MNYPPADAEGIPILDLQLCRYQTAWDRQLKVHEKVLHGELPNGVIILVEHPPVVTFGRRPGSADHLLADQATLEIRGVEVVQSDRGGDITFHGPGQLVVYPIIPLRHYGLGLLEYMRLLEQIVIDTLEPFGICGCRDSCATGVWVHVAGRNKDTLPSLGAAGHCANQRANLQKICAMGVKLRRWTSLHGLALNVTTDLAYFDLINPCGLSRPVTSMHALLGTHCPSMETVKSRMAREFLRQLRSD